MFQMREENCQQQPRQKIRLPALRQQDFLQAENKNKKNKGNLIFFEMKNKFFSIQNECSLASTKHIALENKKRSFAKSSQKTAQSSLRTKSSQKTAQIQNGGFE